jgi:WD40 repeat protein
VGGRERVGCTEGQLGGEYGKCVCWLPTDFLVQTGKARKVYKGHQGPCTSVAVLDRAGKDEVLFTGSWDKTIRVWNAEVRRIVQPQLRALTRLQTGDCISSTNAHTDFVKSLALIPWLNILVSGGSDRQINLWDTVSLATSPSNRSLRKFKTLKDHTRPVEALAVAEPGHLGSAANEAIFYSADSMGVIRSWLVKREDDAVTVTMKDLFEGHHTSVPDLLVGEGGLWSGKLQVHIQVCC